MGENLIPTGTTNLDTSERNYPAQTVQVIQHGCECSTAMEQNSWEGVSKHNPSPSRHLCPPLCWTASFFPSLPALSCSGPVGVISQVFSLWYFSSRQEKAVFSL